MVNVMMCDDVMKLSLFCRTVVDVETCTSHAPLYFLPLIDSFQSLPHATKVTTKTSNHSTERYVSPSQIKEQ
jgi:hypothetical protein